MVLGEAERSSRRGASRGAGGGALVIELLARWEHQCNDITLRGYGSPGDEEPAIEIVAFDSGPWEFTVNDPRRLDTGPLRDLGGRWVLVDERGETRALVDSPDPHDSCGLCYDQRIRRGG